MGRPSVSPRTATGSSPNREASRTYHLSLGRPMTRLVRSGYRVERDELLPLPFAPLAHAGRRRTSPSTPPRGSSPSGSARRRGRTGTPARYAVIPSYRGRSYASEVGGATPEPVEEGPSVSPGRLPEPVSRAHPYRCARGIVLPPRCHRLHVGRVAVNGVTTGVTGTGKVSSRGSQGR